MRKSFATDKYSRHIRRSRGAFTLVEILVALAVMMVMMAIILVPINMGLNVFHIGKARAEVQQANQLVINQLAAELKQAIHVFANEALPGITNKAPYTNNGQKPYYDTDSSTQVDNTARLDFLLPSSASNGSILTPPQANNYIVTYYARRLDDTKAYDVFTNPIVLWRAQYPYRADQGATAIASPYVAANISNTRYSDWTEDSNKWLLQTDGEPNLASTAATLPNFSKQDIGSAASASHTLLTPRDMALVSPVSAVPYLTRAQLQKPAVDLNGNSTIEENETRSYQPDSSFVCDDTDGDGKIDRVTMSLLLQKYDSLGAADDKSQQIRATQTVSLPNIK